MSLQIKGKISEILKSESGVSRNGNSWKKQEFVIDTQEQFPKKVCFTLFNDKASLIDGLSAGNDVEVSFNIESREFNGKWFHNINAWKIERGSKEDMNTPPPSPPPFSVYDIPPEPNQDSDDGLPF
jgi:hypothetical protein